MTRWVAGLAGVAVVTALLWRVEPTSGSPEPGLGGIPDTLANPLPTAEQWQSSVLPQIQEDYREIQAKAPSLAKRGYPVPGGFADIYTNGDQVERITVTRLDGAHQVVEHMFFRGDSLFFVHRRTLPKGSPAASQQALEDRFYFHSGHLVRWRDSARQLVPETAPSFVAQQIDLLRNGQQLLAASRGAMPSLSPHSGR